MTLHCQALVGERRYLPALKMATCVRPRRAAAGAASATDPRGCTPTLVPPGGHGPAMAERGRGRGTMGRREPAWCETVCGVRMCTYQFSAEDVRAASAAGDAAGPVPALHGRRQLGAEALPEVSPHAADRARPLHWQGATAGDRARARPRFNKKSTHLRCNVRGMLCGSTGTCGASCAARSLALALALPLRRALGDDPDHRPAQKLLKSINKMERAKAAANSNFKNMRFEARGAVATLAAMPLPLPTATATCNATATPHCHLC